MSKTNKKYYVWVLGCQMNHSDGEKLEKVLRDSGYVKADSELSADVIAVVACSVKQAAIDRVYGKAKNWQRKRKRNALKTILTGCVLDGDREKLEKLFDVVLDIKEVGKWPSLLSPRVKLKSQKDYLNITAHQLFFRAYVPIMTGCNNFCAYCVVPYVRGREKSRPAREVIAECRDLIKKGYKEIILLGQNVNSYTGSGYDFPKLLKAIDKIKGDHWLRFLTSHPKDLSDDLIRVMADGKHIAPYLHLAVQSGDNEILKVMNRKYTVEKFLRIVAKARRAMPNVMISTDIIVGFPGETKKQFQNTLELFKKVHFDMAYISEYSPRKQTAAAQLKDNVTKDEKDKRRDAVNELLKKFALANNKKYIGREVKVLVDGFKNGKCSGKTDTFKTVTFAGDKKLVGEFVNVKINRADSFGLFE